LSITLSPSLTHGSASKDIHFQRLCLADGFSFLHILSSSPQFNSFPMLPDRRGSSSRTDGAAAYQQQHSTHSTVKDTVQLPELTVAAGEVQQMLRLHKKPLLRHDKV
jgi:hypothetical protein